MLLLPAYVTVYAIALHWKNKVISDVGEYAVAPALPTFVPPLAAVYQPLAV